VPGEPFFAEVAATDTIRLSYSMPSDPQIQEGVRRLASLIGRMT
jgi:DNA-binding transcriptional MocR family regulator